MKNINAINGQRLKQARLDSDKTQKELAQILNITENGYQQYEMSRVSPRADKLKKICLVLNVSSDYLLDLSNVKQRK